MVDGVDVHDFCTYSTTYSQTYPFLMVAEQYEDSSVDRYHRTFTNYVIQIRGVGKVVFLRHKYINHKVQVQCKNTWQICNTGKILQIFPSLFYLGFKVDYKVKYEFCLFHLPKCTGLKVRAGFSLKQSRDFWSTFKAQTFILSIPSAT